MLRRRHHAQTKTSGEAEGRQEEDAPIRQGRHPAGGVHCGAEGGCVTLPPHSGLMLANFTTLDHLSISSVICLPKSVGEPGSTVPPRSTSLALIVASARPELIVRLTLSMISAGVPLGAPTPNRPLAS